MTPQSFIFSSLLLAVAVTVGGHQLSAPVNVNLSSFGFIHLLTWDPGPLSPAGVCYSVKVLLLNSKAIWKNVTECQCVQSPRMCNLTNTFSNFSERYFVRLEATFGNQRSNSVTLEEFVPEKNTVLDPPLVSVSDCGNVLCIKLHPPSDRLHSVYNNFIYDLSFKTDSSSPIPDKTVTGLNTEIELPLETGKNYCVTVSIREREGVISPPQCANLASMYPPDTVPVFVMCFVFILCAGLIFSVMYSQVICWKPDLPNMLQCPVKFPHVHLLPPDYDAPTYTYVSLGQTVPLIKQRKDGGDVSDNEEESDQEMVSNACKSDVGYESRPQQPHHFLTQDDLSNPTVQLSGPNINNSFLFCPAHVTENRCNAVFFTHSQPLLLPLTDKSVVSESLGEDGPISFNDLASKMSLYKHTEEQDIRFPLLMGPKSPQSVSEEEMGLEMEEKGKCSDVNLFSVTLGKYKDEEEDDNEDILDSNFSPDSSDLNLATINNSTESLHSSVKEEVLESCGYMKR